MPPSVILVRDQYKRHRDLRASRSCAQDWIRLVSYDPLDRLTEVQYFPDFNAKGTYTLFQLVWIGDRLVGYWQTDQPGGVTSKRYVGTDETGRPIDMFSWPSSGDATRIWAVNPFAWGEMQIWPLGAGIFQPVLFAGQYIDDWTVVTLADGVTTHRPGLVWNRHRTYDAFTGSYLQLDPWVAKTWEAYIYAAGDPVGHDDPSGLDASDGTGGKWVDTGMCGYDYGGCAEWQDFDSGWPGWQVPCDGIMGAIVCGVGGGLWYCIKNPLECMPGGAGGGGGGSGPTNKPPIDWDEPPKNDNRPRPPTNPDDLCWDWYFEDLEECGEAYANTGDQVGWMRCRNEAEASLEACKNLFGGVSARYASDIKPHGHLSQDYYSR